MRRVLVPLATVLALTLSAQGGLARSAAASEITPQQVTVTSAVHSDVSPPLRTLSPAPPVHQFTGVRPLRHIPRPPGGGQTAAVQSQATTRQMPTTNLNFNGIGNGFSGPAGAFTVSSAPPDPNGAVGPNNYVETVNSDFAVFNKSGTAIYGPVQINTLWSGFGGGCQTNNDGDPSVSYDRSADRWLITQFSVTGANGTTTPFLECVAVSTTGDPTGSYARYAFPYTNFNDYPKIGVWPDAYYSTFNMFNAAGTAFLGGKVCAYDRTRMLAGQAATQQCFDVGTSFGGLLASTVDGVRQPPAGSPNYILALGATANSLAFWKFHVDWTTPANSTLSGPTNLNTAAYTEACNSGGTCIPQAGTTQQLDSLADRLMYRLEYRNFGDHEALVVNHSVTAGSSVGIRWYEIRSPGTTPTIFQQGTYAPDANYRWMGSIAMDQQGNMAMGFSLSGTTISPQIHYTGRLSTDALGTMAQGEGTVINGGGSQSGQNLSRWGDYTSLSVDPTDDCTFWYTNEYIPVTGAFNWSTRVGSFKFPGCGAISSDFSISASPSTLSIAQSGSGTSTISTAVTSGTAGTVSLSASGAPAGMTASLSPTSVTAGGSATLSLAVGASVAPGSYPITVTGTEGTATHSTTVTVTVTAVAGNNFSISASPNALSIAQGGSGTSTISTAVTSGTAGTVTLSASGAPAGMTASLNPTSVTAGGSATLNLAVGASVAPGSYPVTVTGTEGTATHSTTVTVTVTAVAGNNFSISASPNALSIAQGGSGTSTISTAVTSGTAGTVSLSASGAPAGMTASLNPASVTAGGSSTLNLAVGASVAPGSYPVTVTGTEGTATHSTSVTVTVTASGGSGIVNGGFETGTLSGWTPAGSASVSSVAHSGTHSAQIGATTATNGDSSISQTFNAPSTGGTLSFYYQVHCPDTLTYDWATATLKDNTAGTTATVLNKTCSNAGLWVQASAATTGGHSYTLTLISHDDNYAGDPTYTLFDDVAFSTPPPPSSLVNGGFETGTLSGWTPAGSASVSSVAHSGTHSAQIGATTATNGDSSISQTFSAPSTSTTLRFYYQVHCPDTVTYDWATATLKDNTAGTTATVLAKTCSNAGLWVQASAAITGGHSYTLTLISHDDNYASDPTYTLFDDVVLN